MLTDDGSPSALVSVEHQSNTFSRYRRLSILRRYVSPESEWYIICKQRSMAVAFLCLINKLFMDNINDFQVNSERWLSLEDFEGEVWKEIDGQNGCYSVSNLGRIRRNQFVKNWDIQRKIRYTHYHKYKPIIKKVHDNGHGYLVVTLLDKRYYVHRLVGTAFIPNPQSKPEIDHINTIKYDNRAMNLRWVTKSENMRNELTHKSNKLAHADPVIALDYYGNYVAEYQSAADAAKHIGVAPSVVKDAIRGNRSARMAKGFQFVRKLGYNPKSNQLKLLKKSRTSEESVPTAKTIILLDNNNCIQAVYQSATVASSYINFTHGYISRLCRNKLYKYNHTWFYMKDLPEEKQKEVIEIFINNKSDFKGFVWERK